MKSTLRAPRSIFHDTTNHYSLDPESRSAYRPSRKGGNSMAKKKKEESLEDILDRMEEDIQKIRDKTDEDAFDDDDDIEEDEDED